LLAAGGCGFRLLANEAPAASVTFLASPRKVTQRRRPDSAGRNVVATTLLPANILQVGLTRHRVAADLKWPSMAIFPTKSSLQSAATTGIKFKIKSVLIFTFPQGWE
jgi:hypothetical protein